MPVRSPLGENLGKVEDLMFDVRSGRITYAILSHGGFLGFGSKLFPVPWREMNLRFDETTNYFVLDATPQFLERVPSFDREHWPDREAGWQELVEGLFPVHQGIVKSAGDKKLVMTFAGGEAEHTHTVANDAQIMRDGKPATLDDLRAGDRIKVTSEEQAGIRVVTKIEAQSEFFHGYPLEEKQIP
ncbi:MAG: PRC-barrel domain-containing protein [Pirellulales bacterium]|nr:PRC-barrel domain-containing protein [Pirellulales bacterium]